MVLPAPLGPRITHRSSSSTSQEMSRMRWLPPRVTVARETVITASGFTLLSNHVASADPGCGVAHT